MGEPVPHSLARFHGSFISPAPREREFWRIEGYNPGGGSISLAACWTREEAVKLRDEVIRDGIEDFDSSGKLPNRFYDTWYIVHYAPMMHVIVEDGKQ